MDYALAAALKPTATNIAGIVALTAVLLIYQRILFHPLHGYPGPILGKLTDGYGGYHASRKRLHLATFQDLHRYGSVFRSGPNRLVFNTLTAFHDIYLNSNVHKAHLYTKTQFNPETNIFGTLDKERHRQKRKIYGKIPSERSLRTFETTMGAEIDIFLRGLLKFGRESVDMSPLCERLTTEVAGHLAFGQPLHTQTQATNRLFPQAMRSMNAVVSLFISVFWPLLRRLNKKNGHEFSRALQDLIKARMLLPRKSQHDFYSIAAGDDIPSEESLGRSELWAEAVFILPAGGTTMSSALSAAFFYLLRYPEVYARLAVEIRTTFESGADIHVGAQLSGCKYLRAVVDETLRMAPPFVGTFWREHDSSITDPLVVDGHLIPRGTIVGVNPYCLMHNEDYFPNPFEFRPERWLEPENGRQESPEKEIGRTVARRAFAPFALGETGCLGKGMAYLETSLTLAKTMWYFNFEYPLNEAGKMGEGQAGRTDGRQEGRVSAI